MPSLPGCFSLLHDSSVCRSSRCRGIITGIGHLPATAGIRQGRARRLRAAQISAYLWIGILGFSSGSPVGSIDHGIVISHLGRSADIAIRGRRTVDAAHLAMAIAEVAKARLLHVSRPGGAALVGEVVV